MLPRAVRRLFIALCLLSAACTAERPAGLVVAVSVEAAQAPRVKRVDWRRVDAEGRVLKQRTEAGFGSRCARHDARGLLLFAFEVAEEAASEAHLVSTAYADEAGLEVLSEMRLRAPLGERGYLLADLFLDLDCAAQTSACTQERCELGAIRCTRHLEPPELRSIPNDFRRGALCGADTPEDTAPPPGDGGSIREAHPDAGPDTRGDSGPACAPPTCACDDAEACEDASAADPRDCTAPDDPGCRRAHVEGAYCEAGRCRGSCEPGFQDCDANWLLNGCETNIARDDRHCGACNTACDYPGACTDGECMTYRFGHLTGSGDTILRWPANTFAGMAVMTGLDTKLVGVGLGTVVSVLHTPVRVRVGVYEEVNGAPGRLIAETSAFTTDALQQGHPDAHAGSIALEMRVTEPVPLLALKSYWIVMVADGDLYLQSEVDAWPWVYGTSSIPFQDLGHMPGSFQSVTTFTTDNTIAAAVLYGVAVPRH